MAYINLKKIGEGGMGCVYRAEDSDTGEYVALKEMSNQFTYDKFIRDMFWSEVNTLKSMDSQSVVKLAGEAYKDENDNLWVPMEFVEGKNLEQVMKERQQPYGEDEAVKLMTKILDAFIYIHGKNCIHRDIKPSNIMIRPDGTICVIDFGIAKDAMIGATGKTVGMVIGTDGWMSPEQAKGTSIDKRTDIYSLGCVLYYLLTGQQAIEDSTDSVHTRFNIINSTFPDVRNLQPNVSERIRDIIYKATDKNMTKRYQSAKEFKQALKNEHVEHSAMILHIGRAEDNDIVIDDPNSYVSSHHLIVTCEKWSSTGICDFTIEDTSTNGTLYDGRRIHQEKVDFVYPGKSCTAAIRPDSDPVIYLAGREEYPLNWNEVMAKFDNLREKSVQTRVYFPGEDKPTKPTPPIIHPSDDQPTWYDYALSFLMPIIGLILGLVHSNNLRPKRSKACLWTALVSFIISIIIVISTNS